MIARSYLFVPGDRPDRFDKALASGAHRVIVDLEDSLAPSMKDSARALVSSWLTPSKPVVLRVNSADSDWFEDDLALASAPGISAVMIPKVRHPDELRAAQRRLPAGIRLLPLIECAHAFFQALAIAQFDGVERLVFGHLDFQNDLRIQGDSEELHYFRSHLVLVSRLAGVQPPVDSVAASIGDIDGLIAETRRARRFGFGAKLCIHPAQVPYINESFIPSSDEVAWARRVLDALAASKGSATLVDGKMIDRPLLSQAQEILEQADGARPGS